MITTGKHAISQDARFDLTRKIVAFLVSKGVSRETSLWHGRLKKSEQVSAFGFYFGKGLITVDGNTDCVYATIKVAFGRGVDVVSSISAHTGWIDTNRAVYIDDSYHLFDPLNMYAEIAPCQIEEKFSL